MLGLIVYETLDISFSVILWSSKTLIKGIYNISEYAFNTIYRLLCKNNDDIDNKIIYDRFKLLMKVHKELVANVKIVE